MLVGGLSILSSPTNAAVPYETEERALLKLLERRKSAESDAPVRLLFIGNAMGHEWDYRTVSATPTPAGVLWQQNLLRSLDEAGLRPSRVLSQRPLRLFPNSKSIVELPGAFEVGAVSARKIPFVNVPGLRKVTAGAYVFGQVVVWALRNRGHPRVVMQYNLTEPPGLCAWLGTRLTKSCFVPFIGDVNIPGRSVKWSVPRAVDYKAHRHVLPRSEGLVVVTDAIAHDFAPGVPHVRVDAALDLADLEHLDAPGARADERFHMVYAGALDPWEGITELIDAVSGLPADDFRLTIAGGGPLADSSAAASKRHAHIEYAGRLPRDELLRLYKTADLLVIARDTSDGVMPPYFFPSRLTEFLGSGVPVLATRYAHMAEEYGPYIYLLEDRSAKAMAERIAEIAGRPRAERQELGARAREYAVEQKTWTLHGQRIAAFLTELCGTRGRR